MRASQNSGPKQAGSSQVQEQSPTPLGRVRLCGSHAPRQGASRVVTPRQSPGKQVASDKAWHLRGTFLVAVQGWEPVSGGLQAGRVMRLVAGVRHGFLPPVSWGLGNCFQMLTKYCGKKNIYVKKDTSVWIKYTGVLDFCNKKEHLPGGKYSWLNRL